MKRRMTTVAKGMSLATLLAAAGACVSAGNSKSFRGLDGKADGTPETGPLVSAYVRDFNATDDETHSNAVPNSAAEEFLARNAPRFACPDADIERTYYFRWWTLRKHLRHDLGVWTFSEFLRNVCWAGAGNTIVCAAGHHLREARWLRDPQYVTDYARFWLSDERASHRWKYSSWLFTATRQAAEVIGSDDLPAQLLDDAVRYYETWEKGVPHGAKRSPRIMGGDGKGGFVSYDNDEGTEVSLGGNGYKPLFSSAMWSEAKSIEEVARAAGRKDLADKFAARADRAAAALVEHCWNDEVGFFTTETRKGGKGVVRELHGYAPWYFGAPVGDRRPDWAQLTDPEGFAAKCGLSFPERRAKGFKISYTGHECQWNGPSWPMATSLALTAYANDLHLRPDAKGREAFASLMRQYAAQQTLTRPDGTVVPWIDENLNPDRPDWIARTFLIKRAEKQGKKSYWDRGKDYNHSTYCDLVISGLVGFIPRGAKGFTVDPLCPTDWSYMVLENLRYRGHDVDIRWLRGKGLSVSVDGKPAASRDTLGPLSVGFPTK